MDSQNDFPSTIPVDYLVQVFERHPVLLAYLYGSTASGHTSPFSDVDIALLVLDSVLPTEYLQLELTIEDEIVQTDEKDFLSDPTKLGAARYYLQISIYYSFSKNKQTHKSPGKSGDFNRIGFHLGGGSRQPLARFA